MPGDAGEAQLHIEIPLLGDADQRNRTMLTKPYEHAAGYRDLLGLPPVPTMRRARVRRLTIYVDFAQNSHKIAPYRRLRAALPERLPQSGAAARAGVYLKRGSTGDRISSGFSLVLYSMPYFVIGMTSGALVGVCLFGMLVSGVLS